MHEKILYMLEYSEFINNCEAVESRVAAACDRYGRDRESVRILPVTKNHPATAVQYAVRYGFESVGENRVQEALDKHAQCLQLPVQWEIIGHLQSNKARRAAETFDRVQSVDTEKLARRLNDAAEADGRVLAILLQVNAGNDPAKYGVDCDAVAPLLETVLGFTNLRVDGLMTIAPLDEDEDVAKRCFMRLRESRDFLAERFGVPLSELSMGMSGDLEPAIEAGSTMIRVGTALFGEREYA